MLSKVLVAVLVGVLTFLVAWAVLAGLDVAVQPWATLLGLLAGVAYFFADRQHRL